MHESSTDSEVTFRRGLGSAEVLTTRPGVDPLEVTRPLPDFSWTTQSPIATSPSVMVLLACSLLRCPTCSVLRPPRSNRKHGIGPHQKTHIGKTYNPYTLQITVHMCFTAREQAVRRRRPASYSSHIMDRRLWRRVYFFRCNREVPASDSRQTPMFTRTASSCRRYSS